jgi:hypothetical protein
MAQVVAGGGIPSPFTVRVVAGEQVSLGWWNLLTTMRAPRAR